MFPPTLRLGRVSWITVRKCGRRRPSGGKVPTACRGPFAPGYCGTARTRVRPFRNRLHPGSQLLVVITIIAVLIHCCCRRDPARTREPRGRMQSSDNLETNGVALARLNKAVGSSPPVTSRPSAAAAPADDPGAGWAGRQCCLPSLGQSGLPTQSTSIRTRRAANPSTEGNSPIEPCYFIGGGGTRSAIRLPVSTVGGAGEAVGSRAAGGGWSGGGPLQGVDARRHVRLAAVVTERSLVVGQRQGFVAGVVTHLRQGRRRRALSGSASIAS